MRLADAVEGCLHAVRGGWEVRTPDGKVIARIQTRGEPPALQLACEEDQWIGRWDEDAYAMVATSRHAPEATLTASTFGADATLRSEPGGPEVKLDCRRVPRRRWHLGVNTTITKGRGEDDVLLRFTGRADPLLLLLALWHVALAEGDDPSRRALHKPEPLADRASPWGPVGSAGA